MKRYLIGIGAIVVIMGSLLPAVTWTVRYQFGTTVLREDTGSNSSLFNFVPALIIMLLLNLQWKSRAVIILVVAVIACIGSPLLSVWLFNNDALIVALTMGPSLDDLVGGPPRTNMALGYGNIVVTLGYLLVIIGCIRDIVIQRRQTEVEG